MSASAAAHAAVPIPFPPPPPDLEKATAEERVRWAADTFGEQLVMTTSFGIQSAVMLHLVTRIVPEIPVVFIDTGYLFPETYRFAQELTERLKLNLKTYNPAMSAARLEALHGKLWEAEAKSPELERYKLITKKEPGDRAVRELRAKAWLAGLRRTQGSTREALPVVQKQNKITKIHPILDWNNQTIYRYLQQHGLPYHPLFDQGYVSVGDWHSTKKLEPGMSEEDTRGGAAKRECGLHEPSGRGDFSI
jgi:phosphoadenosine phosphosulfate reductase